MPVAEPTNPPAASSILPAHRRLQVAPMMELTDRHFRWLARRLSRHTLLWTEMLTADAVLNGDRERLLGCDEVEHPCVLQLGGSDPGAMAEAAAIGASFGYGEIDMNVGCPSDRVRSGRFGACLMAEPELVSEVVRAMADAVAVPVTVKCRLGIDRDDSYEALERFVATVADTGGVSRFVVHARKAWLDGLSPKQNRTVPPLRHEYVHRLKATMPDLHVTINGGIGDWDAIEAQLGHVDGVMIGRSGYHDPALLGEADARLFGELGPGVHVSRDIDQLCAVARDYARYMQGRMDEGLRCGTLARHLLALIQDVPGARRFRRLLSEGAPKATDAVALVDAALEPLERAAFDETRRSA